MQKRLAFLLPRLFTQPTTRGRIRLFAFDIVGTRLPFWIIADCYKRRSLITTTNNELYARKLNLSKARAQLVLIAQDDLGRIEFGIAFERWPLDPDGGVVPHEAALIIGMIDVIAFVAKLGSIGQNEETMCKPTRDEELALVLSRKHHALPLAIRRANFAQVNSTIEDLA